MVVGDGYYQKKRRKKKKKLCKNIKTTVRSIGIALHEVMLLSVRC